MKLDFLEASGGKALQHDTGFGLSGETDILRHVALADPLYLDPVPCCAATRRSLRDGFQTTTVRAREQHHALRRLLERGGATCQLVPASAGLPDLCFIRDASVMTPWGLLLLRPARSHRRAEIEQVETLRTRLDIPLFSRLAVGQAEGGDICVARPGLLIIGRSGDRTDEYGASAVAALFQARGWDVLVADFDPHFLHLDTIFCMVDASTALAFTEALPESFLAALDRRGIDLIPIGYRESGTLGCNVLSLGEERIIAARGNPRVAELLRERGFMVEELDLSEFIACGGGPHCLTLPLARVHRGATRSDQASELFRWASSADHDSCAAASS